MTSEDYEPIIRIRDLEDFRDEEEGSGVGDRRDGRFYRYGPDIKLRVNIAAATGRPLLVLGPSGCGKSSLAFNLARVTGRAYYEFVVTSRSESKDLLYRFDAVRRLGDAQARGRGHRRGRHASGTGDEYYPYIEPGPIWWCLDPATAARRGYPGTGELAFLPAQDPAVWRPDGGGAGTVLLIDEVDKAEADFPNNLLVPLGSNQFTIGEVAQTVRLGGPGPGTSDRATDPAPDGFPAANHVPPLVIITSNRERELPEAFTRRCIVLEIPPPGLDDLVAVALASRRSNSEAEAAKLRGWAEQARAARGPEPLSTAEFLDVVRAMVALQASDTALAELVQGTAWRPEQS